MKEITVGSEWKSIYEVHRGDLIRVEGVDSRTVHILWVNTGHRKAWPVDSFLTHFVEYDKPDVLPVEGVSVAEALEALARLPSLMLISSPGAARVLSPIRSALERAAAEGEAHRWVPVSERMPAEGAPVWAFDEGEVCPAYWSGQFWWVAGDGPTLDCVTEWMPRYVPPTPAPPKGSTP